MKKNNIMNINELEKQQKEKEIQEILLTINMYSCEQLRSVIENLLSNVCNPSQVNTAYHYICGDK